jgi:Type II secretion system protein B
LPRYPTGCWIKKNKNGIVKLSSILTALKKLENQAKNKGPFWLRQQKNQGPTPRTLRISDHLHANKRYLIILAGLILAGAAGMTLHQKIRHNHRKVAEKPIVVAKTETRTKRPAYLLDKKPVVSNRVETKPLIPQKTIIPDHAQKEAKMPPTPVYTPPVPPLNGVNNNKALLPKPVNGINNGKATLSKPAEKGTIEGKSIETHEPQVKAERFARVPVKRSGETNIEIQAIAWSKDPKSRLAVINGLILREGESIDNVIVVDIGKDAVVFEKNRQEWKQLFGF